MTGTAIEVRATGACTLYRHFDAAGRLLYVGISLQPFVRLREHGLRSGWWDRIASVTMERFASRTEAHAAEREAIRTEKPAHNAIRFDGGRKALLGDPVEPMSQRFKDILKRITGITPIRHDWRTMRGCCEVLDVSERQLLAMLDRPSKPIVFSADDILALSDRILRGTVADDPPWRLGSPLPGHMSYKPDTKMSAKRMQREDEAFWASVMSSAPPMHLQAPSPAPAVRL